MLVQVIMMGEQVRKSLMVNDDVRRLLTPDMSSSFLSVTALHLAACCNKLSVIEYLVGIPGIKVNPLDRCCCTPLDGEYIELCPPYAYLVLASYLLTVAAFHLRCHS